MKQNICNHTVVLWRERETHTPQTDRQKDGYKKILKFLMLISTLHPNTQKGRKYGCDLGFSAEDADCTSWNENYPCMYKYCEEQKAQKSSLVQIRKHCVVFRAKAATTQLSLIGEKSHAELQEDQKVRDTGRGMALSQRALRQNQARRFWTLADWCAWNALLR